MDDAEDLQAFEARLAREQAVSRSGARASPGPGRRPPIGLSSCRAIGLTVRGAGWSRRRAAGPSAVPGDDPTTLGTDAETVIRWLVALSIPAASC